MKIVHDLLVYQLISNQRNVFIYLFFNQRIFLTHFRQCNNCNTTKSPRIYSSTSFSNYSFQKGLNELVDYLRNLINQYNHENIFVQLFEHMCTIRGLSSINLDRLKEQCQPGNENQNQIYQEILGKIDQLSRSFKVLIELNKIKISHIDQHSVIMNSFIQFHQNFQVRIY